MPGAFTPTCSEEHLPNYINNISNFHSKGIEVICLIVNVLMLEIIKEGSSVYFNMINTLKLPIQALLASFPSIAGKNYTKITFNHLFSFILIIVSILVYNDENEINNYHIHAITEYVQNPLPFNSECIDDYTIDQL